MNLQAQRLAALVSLLIVTPIGFASKFYGGLGAWWFNNYAGGILYEVFWCLLILLLWPGAPASLTVACIFAITCSLEFLQLWHPRFLQTIRATFIGRTLIGTSFSWWDIPHYFIGCLAGWFWMGFIRKIGVQSGKRTHLP
jgi:hypothetical protein